jgi:gliding motility-associated protein GldE
LEPHSIPYTFCNSIFPWLAIHFSSTSTVLICIAVFLLILLFFINGAEVALFSLNYKDISLLKTKQEDAAKRIVNFLENPKGLLGSITIANSVLTIAIIILANFILTNLLQEMTREWILIFLIKVVLIGFFLVLFGNILPKVWAAQNNIRFAKNSSLIIEVIYLLFGNISKPLIQVSDSLDSKFGNEEKSRLDGELLDYAIDKLPEEEASHEEKQILKGIRKFGNTTVKQVMRQRLDVHGIEYRTSFHELISKTEELHYSRLPVYEHTLDELKGIIYTKDLLPFLHEPDSFNWQSLIKPIVFVHEQKMIEDLLQEFRQKHIHIAVVVDEFGGTSGIVTLEDILEEIIGEIKDEFDEEETTENKIDDHTYVFDGKLMINDFCKKMNIAVDTFDKFRGESDSIGGLLLELTEAIPEENQLITCGDFQFTVLELEKNRIKKIKVQITKN